MGQTVHEGNDHIQSIQSICRKTLEIDLFVYSALLKYPNPNPCKHFRVDDLRTKVGYVIVSWMVNLSFHLMMIGAHFFVNATLG